MVFLSEPKFAKSQKVFFEVYYRMENIYWRDKYYWVIYEIGRLIGRLEKAAVLPLRLVYNLKWVQRTLGHGVYQRHQEFPTNTY